jgi:hypothetical protein
MQPSSLASLIVKESKCYTKLSVTLAFIKYFKFKCVYTKKLNTSINLKRLIAILIMLNSLYYFKSTKFILF